MGEGGYGTVYLSEINGTFIAVKKVNISSVPEEDVNEITALRFIKQTFHLCCFNPSYYSLLHHPNIVVFMGYAIEDNHAYICTNYVHGGDLFKLLFKDVSYICSIDLQVAIYVYIQTLLFLFSEDSTHCE